MGCLEKGHECKFDPTDIFTLEYMLNEVDDDSKVNSYILQKLVTYDSLTFLKFSYQIKKSASRKILEVPV